MRTGAPRNVAEKAVASLNKFSRPAGVAAEMTGGRFANWRFNLSIPARLPPQLL